MKKIKLSLIFIFLINNFLYSNDFKVIDQISCSEAAAFLQIAASEHIDISPKGGNDLESYYLNIPKSILYGSDPENLLLLDYEADNFLHALSAKAAFYDLLYGTCELANAIGDYRQEKIDRNIEIKKEILKSINEEDIINVSTQYELYKNRASTIEEFENRLKNQVLTEIKNLIFIENKDFKTSVKIMENKLEELKKYFNALGKKDFESLNIIFLLDSLLQAMDTMTTYMPHETYMDFKETIFDGSFEGIGARVIKEKNTDGLIVQKVFKNGPSYNKLMVNDRIITLQYKNKFYDLKKLDEKNAVKIIKGPKGSIIKLTVLRKLSNKLTPLTFLIKRDEIFHAENMDVELIEKENKKIIFIKFIEFTSETATFIEKKVSEKTLKNKIDGVVLDLTDNIGGNLSEAIKIADLFSDQGVVVYAKTVFGINQLTAKQKGELFPKIPMIVMINERSASASEMIAGYLKDINRAIIVGSKTTFGKGTMQEIIDHELYYSHLFTFKKSIGRIKVTTGKFFTPSGKTPQDRGVESHILIPSLVPEINVTNKDLLFTSPYEELSDVESFPIYDFNYSQILPDLTQNSHERVEKNSLLQRIKNDPDSIFNEGIQEVLIAHKELKKEAVNIMIDALRLLKE